MDMHLWNFIFSFIPRHKYLYEQHCNGKLGSVLTNVALTRTNPVAAQHNKGLLGRYEEIPFHAFKQKQLHNFAQGQQNEKCERWKENPPSFTPYELKAVNSLVLHLSLSLSELRWSFSIFKNKAISFMPLSENNLIIW